MERGGAYITNGAILNNGTRWYLHNKRCHLEQRNTWYLHNKWRHLEGQSSGQAEASPTRGEPKGGVLKKKTDLLKSGEIIEMLHFL